MALILSCNAIILPWNAVCRCVGPKNALHFSVNLPKKCNVATENEYFFLIGTL
jgi:hypothetical protein